MRSRRHQTPHDGKRSELGWECRIGLTTYDDQEDPVLSRSSLTSLRSTFRKSHSREVVLSALTEVERKAPFKITFFDAMWGENEIGPHGIEEAVLSSAWVEGTNPGIQVSLTREDLLSGDHVWRRSVEELFTALTSTCLSPVLIQSQLSAEPSVFISYRRSSVRYGGELRRNRILDDLKSAAREQGFDVFIDRQMSPGIDYQLELLKQVEGAWIYVPLIVPEYVNPEWNDPTAPESRFQNDWVYRELDAIPQSAQIVPLLLDARPSEYIGHVERKNLPALHELNAIPLNPDETGSINEYETSSFKQILQERREH